MRLMRTIGAFSNPPRWQLAEELRRHACRARGLRDDEPLGVAVRDRRRPAVT